MVEGTSFEGAEKREKEVKLLHVLQNWRCSFIFYSAIV
jgi:hypothetical protein